MNALHWLCRISVAGAVCLAASLPARAQKPTTAPASSAASIHRLDGSTITTAEAAALVRQTMMASHIPGLQIAVLNHGKPVWVRSFGSRDLEQKQAMDNDTVMWAASITKSVFATFAMKLVEAGELDLDKPIAQVLPQPFSAYDRYKDLADDARAQKITPRHLLSHTAGFANFAFLEPDHHLRIHWEPGTRYAYSGEGLNLLQFVIEQKSGRLLKDMMEERIFTPLSMTRTGMVWEDGFVPNISSGYTPDGKALPPAHRSNARAAGSMDTSINDLVKFTQALLAGKLLSTPLQNQMLSPQIQIHTAHQFPTLDAESGTEAAKVGLAYGLGWGLLTNTPYGRAFFKEGHGDGAQNYMICFEKGGGDCLILLTNSENGEFAFKPLLEKILGDTVTPWVWHGYTPELIRKTQWNDHPDLAPPPPPKPQPKKSWVRKEAEKVRRKL